MESKQLKGLGFLLLLFLLTSCATVRLPDGLKVSANGHFFRTTDGKPFFWLGDTGWLLFNKLSRKEVVRYLNTRKRQGFNVVQAMVLHSMDDEDFYRNKALYYRDISKPLVTTGNNFRKKTEYDFWDQVDFVIDEANKRGIYMALVPVWGSAIKRGEVTPQQITEYMNFLIGRYKDKKNIIWVNGGDVRGDDRPRLWEAIGKVLEEKDSTRLVTFHPRGRYSSSDWFDSAPWLDFNMFQSGHRAYEQDTSIKEKHHYGEDNWRYVQHDWNLVPSKPTLDGEPSYENIPKGLHDSLETRWTDDDVRRYAYWSVFAGGAGFTYGDNAVMQFYTKKNGRGAYGVRKDWKHELHASGAGQMKYLKKFMLSHDYFDRIPAQDIIVDNVGKRYNYLLATKGPDYALVYAYLSKSFKIDFSKLGFTPREAKWYNPTNGKYRKVNSDWRGLTIGKFMPPSHEKNRPDVVLVLEK